MRLFTDDHTIITDKLGGDNVLFQGGSNENYH